MVFSKSKKLDQLTLQQFLYLALYVREGEKAFPKEILHQDDFKIYYHNFGHKAHDMAFIASDNNDIVGLAWARCFEESDQAHGFVDRDIPELTISVLPQYRGKGIGTSLLKNLIEHYRLEAYKGISLSVDNQNDKAAQLYYSLGFIFHSAQPTANTLILNF